MQGRNRLPPRSGEKVCACPHGAIRALGRRRNAAPDREVNARPRRRRVKFSLKPFSKGLQGVGQSPTTLVAFGKRRKIGKQSSGLFSVRNPRRGFLDGIEDATRTSASQPTLPAKACAALWRKRAGRATAELGGGGFHGCFAVRALAYALRAFKVETF